MDDKTLQQNFPQDVPYVRPLRYWVQMVLPLVYDDSLSYYELLNKVVMKLNELVKTCNELAYIYNHIDEYIDNKIAGIEDSLMDKLKQYIDEILPPMLEDFVTKQELQAEATTRAQADQTLQANINEEATKRADADKTLQDAITAEENTRLQQDIILQANINGEAQTRKQDDDALRALITQEAAERRAADTNMQNQITQLNGDFGDALLAEENARKSADTALQDQINAISGDLTDFATKTALNQEISAREAGDNALRALIESKGGGEYTNEKAQFAVRCVQPERANDFVAVSETEFYVMGAGATPEVYHYTETEKTVVGTYGITGIFKATNGVYGWKTETDGLHVVKIDSTSQSVTIPGFPAVDAVSDVANDGFVYACYHNGANLDVHRIKGDFTGSAEEVGTYAVNEFESTSITEFSWISAVDADTDNTKQYFSVFSPDLGLAVYDVEANGLVKWIACPNTVDYLEQGLTIGAKCSSINTGWFLTHNDIRQAYNYFSIVKYDLVKGVSSQISQQNSYLYTNIYSLIPSKTGSPILRVCAQLATNQITSSENRPNESNIATHISKTLAINNLQYAGALFIDAPCRFNTYSLQSIVYANESSYFTGSGSNNYINNLQAYCPVKVENTNIGTLLAQQGSVFKNCVIQSLNYQSYGSFLESAVVGGHGIQYDNEEVYSTTLASGSLRISLSNLASVPTNYAVTGNMFINQFAITGYSLDYTIIPIYNNRGKTVTFGSDGKRIEIVASYTASNIITITVYVDGVKANITSTPKISYTYTAIHETQLPFE